MANYEPVIDKLVDKSEAGTLPWKPTFNDNTFIVALEGETTFEVTRLGESFQLLMKDKDDKRIIELVSYNRRKFEEGWVSDDLFFDKLQRLYEAARVTALEVNQKLDAAQQLLDKF